MRILLIAAVLTACVPRVLAPDACAVMACPGGGGFDKFEVCNLPIDAGVR